MYGAVNALKTGQQLHAYIRERIELALGPRSWNWLAHQTGIPRSTLGSERNKPKFSLDVVLLVGHHARASSRPGIMAHTVSYPKFKQVRLAGQPVGETELFLVRAGEFSWDCRQRFCLVHSGDERLSPCG